MLQDIKIVDLLEKKRGIKNLCQDYLADNWGMEDTLLYLVQFGSHLYGTATESSDQDFKGIYLPGIKNLALGRIHKTISYSTCNHKQKNRPEDLDIELYSLPYWLSLLKKGETIATDLLFSHTNDKAVVYLDLHMNMFFRNVSKLIDTQKLLECAYIRYAKSQSLKYGIKGTRVKTLERVLEFARTLQDGDKIGQHFQALEHSVNDIKYVRICGDSIEVCGKMHQFRTPVPEFINRIEQVVNEYGNRARAAMGSGGIDWKAISHCLRALNQTEELLKTGNIKFPLASAPFLKQVKMGKWPWEFIRDAIDNGILYVSGLIPAFTGVWDQEFIDKAIIDIYKLEVK